MRTEINLATFYAFKSSGKYYSAGRAYLDPRFFREWPDDRRKFLLELTGGKYPGLSGTGSELTWVIVPDDDHENGFPILLKPRREL